MKKPEAILKIYYNKFQSDYICMLTCVIAVKKNIGIFELVWISVWHTLNRKSSTNRKNKSSEKNGEQMSMTDIMLDLLKETGYYLGANETNL